PVSSCSIIQSSKHSAFARTQNSGFESYTTENPSDSAIPGEGALVEAGDQLLRADSFLLTGWVGFVSYPYIWLGYSASAANPPWLCASAKSGCGTCSSSVRTPFALPLSSATPSAASASALAAMVVTNTALS